MVSIIICTNRDIEDLVIALRHVVNAAEHSTHEFEIILVLNVATLDKKSVTCSCDHINKKIRVVIEPKIGKSCALNCGIAAANYKYLMFTDDDCYVPIDWVSSYTPHFYTNKPVVTGMVHLNAALQRSWMETFHLACLAQVPCEDLRINIVGANWAVRKELLTQIGCFDENLGPGTFCGLGEDTLVARKLVDIVGDFTVNTRGIVVHNPDVSRLERQQWISHVGKISRSHFYIQNGTEPKNTRVSFMTVVLYARYLLVSIHEKLRNSRSPITARELTAYQRFYSGTLK